jgi:hypothetical protein
VVGVTLRQVSVLPWSAEVEMVVREGLPNTYHQPGEYQARSEDEQRLVSRKEAEKEHGASPCAHCYPNVAPERWSA